jgi:3-deoxy-D-manno-octulosonate 8-phosphate phosphatase (KDO 8-P phosphatase)
VSGDKGRPCPADIGLVGFDVDGVFTDGRFYLSDAGVETKAFSTQDGYGIRQLLDAGIGVAVISGRQSEAVERRMAELGVGYVFQGCSDKVAAFDRVLGELGIGLAQSAFAGDDVPDLALLRHAGYAFAVANAVPEVRAACDAVTVATGGRGAVREICETVLAARSGYRTA